MDIYLADLMQHAEREFVTSSSLCVMHLVFFFFI